MRNLNWLAAVVVMVVTGSAMGQVTTVVPQTDPGGNPGPGKIYVYATGKYTTPIGKVAAKVEVDVYEIFQLSPGVGTVYRGTTSDSLLLAVGNYDTGGGQIALEKGKTYYFKGTLYVNKANGGTEASGQAVTTKAFTLIDAQPK
jgi:hypothetical protein